MSKSEVDSSHIVESKGTIETSVMDIGKNCWKCNQLDFLPFHCEFCKNSFCSNHRTLESHQCPRLDKVEEKTTHAPYSGPTASSLFPDREADKKKLESSIKESTFNPTTILEKAFRVGDVSSNTPNAFSKFNKFLTSQKKRTKSGSLGKLLGSSSFSMGPKRVNVSEIVNLKRNAKGDNKIGTSDRVYIWCVYINPHQSNTDEESFFEQLNIEKERKALFVSKAWPVGRALDSIADNLRITNANNSNVTSIEKLHIFKLLDGIQTLVNTSERVSKTLQNGDTVYLVRGTL